MIVAQIIKVKWIYRILFTICAIAISVISFAISAYSILRDKSQIKAWSYLFYDTADKPSLRIIVLNTGRRPINLQCICFEYSEGVSRRPFNNICIITDKKGRFQGIEDMLAHRTCIRLNEGEVYEENINNEDSFHILHIEGNKAEEPKIMWVEDVEGKKYKIKKARKTINEYFDKAT